MQIQPELKSVLKRLRLRHPGHPARPLGVCPPGKTRLPAVFGTGAFRRSRAPRSQAFGEPLTGCPRAPPLLPATCSSVKLSSRWATSFLWRGLLIPAEKQIKTWPACVPQLGLRHSVPGLVTTKDDCVFFSQQCSSGLSVPNARSNLCAA
jgi:hypothetical protein